MTNKKYKNKSIVKRIIKKITINPAKRIFKAIAEEIIKQAERRIIKSIAAAIHIREFYPANYFPWTASSLRLDCLITIINDIIFKRRKLVVELGGGVSTLIIAKVLAKHGGHLYTFEEDSRWVDFINAHITREGLGEYVSVCMRQDKSCFWKEKAFFGIAKTLSVAR